MKLCIPIFNRATYSRIRTVIDECLRQGVDVTLVLGSSITWREYGSVHKYVEKNHPGAFVHILPRSNSDRTQVNVSEDIGALISSIGRHFADNYYDAVLVVADRYETISAAIAANIFNMCVFHIQGGEVTNNIDDRVRHAVTKLSDYHFVSTRLARQYLIQMGEDKKRVYTTGCPGLDFIRNSFSRHTDRRFCRRDKYFMVIHHPMTEDVEKAYIETEEILRAAVDVCHKAQVHCVWYAPNNDLGREKILELVEQAELDYPNVFSIIRNEDTLKFLDRLRSSQFIIGNSSSTIRESGFMGVPSILIGDRQGYRERGMNVVEMEYDDDIRSQMMKFIGSIKYPSDLRYGNGIASKSIVDRLIKCPKILKDTLTYPFWPEFKEDHFSKERRRKNAKTNQIHTRGIEGFIPRQPKESAGLGFYTEGEKCSREAITD